MAFDIHGEHLEKGHCEVHPWVAHEYPCPICMRDLDDLLADRQDERQQPSQIDYYEGQIEALTLDLQKREKEVAFLNEKINELTAEVAGLNESQWVSVNDRLPEGKREVLAINNHGDYLVGFIRKGEYWGYECHSHSDGTGVWIHVKAWRELPKQPTN